MTRLLALSLLSSVACSGAPNAPVAPQATAAAAPAPSAYEAGRPAPPPPPLSTVTTPAGASSLPPTLPPTSAKAATSAAVAPPAAEPEPSPPTDGLSRGSGDPADRELAQADAAYQAEKYAQARAHFRRAEQLAPKDPAPKVGLVRVSVAEADLPLDYASAAKDPRLPGLLRLLDAALKLDPDFAPALMERGQLLLIQGKAEAASSALERAVQLAPRHAEAQSALGVALLALGRAKESLAYFERAAALDRDNPER
ncbi:MAG TPA: tetratricopeptide repeat protein, partial [Polyangiaceae bacterium]|nr:tetratricopeptide repeat protein [Polyangiaceae bacterium]